MIFRIYNKNTISKDDYLGCAVLNLNTEFGFGDFKKNNLTIDLITNKRRSGDI